LIGIDWPKIEKIFRRRLDDIEIALALEGKMVSFLWSLLKRQNSREAHVHSLA
jgi:hypothetical protein